MKYTKNDIVNFIAGTFNNMFAYGNNTISKKDAIDYLKYIEGYLLSEDKVFDAFVKTESEYGEKTRINIKKYKDIYKTFDRIKHRDNK